MQPQKEKKYFKCCFEGIIYTLSWYIYLSSDAYPAIIQKTSDPVKSSFLRVIRKKCLKKTLNPLNISQVKYYVTVKWKSENYFLRIIIRKQHDISYYENK